MEQNSQNMFLIFLLLDFVLTHITPVPGQICTLWRDNFEQTLSLNPFVFVHFYATWSPQSTLVHRDFNYIAFDLGSLNVIVCEFDVTNDHQFRQQHKIEAYPTIRLYIKSQKQPIEYFGARNAASMLSFVIKGVSPVSELIDGEQLERITKDTGKIPACIYFGRETENEQMLGQYKQVVGQIDDAKFYHTFKEHAVRQFTHKWKTSVIVFKDGEIICEFDQVWSKDEFHKFIHLCLLPDMQLFNKNAGIKIFQEKQPALLLFIGEDDSSKKAMIEYQKLASTLKDKLLFTYTRALEDKDNFDAASEFFGIPTSEGPKLILVVKRRSLLKYKYEGVFDELDIIKKFLIDFYDNKLQPYWKSQPVQNTDSELQVLIRSNYDSLVINNTQDVLVFYSSPKSSLGSEAAQTAYGLANLLQGNKNLTISLCDSTKNDIPGVEIVRFPTIYFYVNQAKGKPIKYTGEISVLAMLEFIKENTSYKWS